MLAVDPRTGTTTLDLWPPADRPETEETHDVDDWLALIATGRCVGVTAEAPPASEPEVTESGPKPISPWVIAPVSGAVAAVGRTGLARARFTSDPYFPTEWGGELYAAWARNLVMGAADVVIVGTDTGIRTIGGG